MSEGQNGGNSAVAASAKGATFLILLQIGSRALTFALNQVLLRFLTPELLGAALHLEVFVITAHHFARESLRVACQRHPAGGIQAPINLSYLSIGAGLAIVGGLGELYLHSDYPQVENYVSALRICQVAAIVELFSEPAFVVVQQKLLYKVRASAEASAVVMKTLATAGLVLVARHRNLEQGVLPFAAGELAYCATLTMVYLWQTSSVARIDNFHLSLRKITPSAPQEYFFSLFSKPLVSLGASLYFQSGIKYLLTQGDTLVSQRFATLKDQGMYALAANYGGLIARMLLRPIEDASRNLFSRLCHDQTDAKAANEKIAEGDTTSTDIRQAASILHLILRFYSIVSLVAIALGPTIAPLLLSLVAGSRWSDSGAGEVLGIYCYSIPLLAINGVSEAFVAAAASASELRRQGYWMTAFSVGFAASTWFFLSVMKLGAKGLVLANCVNMALRILFNLEFAKRYLKGFGTKFNISSLLPNGYAIALTGIAASLVASKNDSLMARYGFLGELARVGLLGGLYTVFLIWTERRFLMECFRQFKAR